ncbi:MAG TPA: cupin domain-containing protein [Acidimicrobiales bacterium]
MEKKSKPATIKGVAETFTGEVWIDPIVTGEEPSRIRVNSVRFSPGARSAWHSHVLGQTLCVTDGVGQVQTKGQERVIIQTGDVVTTPPHEVHWHGALSDHYMTHLSITEGVGPSDEPETNWMHHVTDAEYFGE